MKRRIFLKETLIASITTTIALFSPTSFAKWKKDTFGTTSVNDAMKAIGADKAKDSDKVIINVPKIAENGHIVPIEVTTKLEDVSQIHLLIKENVSPLAASFTFHKKTIPIVKSRFKVAKKSDIIAVVQSGDKTYKATTHVNVTIGGCGG